MLTYRAESPINYPWGRTKRAAIKSKNKWATKLHLKKKKEQEES
jgi:aquaglyceroporin related protein